MKQVLLPFECYSLIITFFDTSVSRNKYWCGIQTASIVYFDLFVDLWTLPALALPFNKRKFLLPIECYSLIVIFLVTSVFFIGSSKHCRHNGFWDRSSNRLYSCLCIMPDQLTKHCLEFFESRANNPDASAFYFPGLSALTSLCKVQSRTSEANGRNRNKMLIF